MRKAILVVAILSFIGLTKAAVGQTLEMAAKCETLEKQLAELVKKPEGADAQKIKEALGLDILNSCATTEGNIICYQCVDKENNLRTLQLLRKADTKRFELLGFGCKCNDSK
jgi:hypothetical protein